MGGWDRYLTQRLWKESRPRLKSLQQFNHHPEVGYWLRCNREQIKDSWKKNSTSVQNNSNIASTVRAANTPNRCNVRGICRNQYTQQIIRKSNYSGSKKKIHFWNETSQKKIKESKISDWVPQQRFLRLFSKSFLPKSSFTDDSSSRGQIVQQPREKIQQYADYSRIEMPGESVGRQNLGMKSISVAGEKFLRINERRSDPTLSQQAVASMARADSKNRIRSQAEISGGKSSFFDWFITHFITKWKEIVVVKLLEVS